MADRHARKGWSSPPLHEAPSPTSPFGARAAIFSNAPSRGSKNAAAIAAHRLGAAKTRAALTLSAFRGLGGATPAKGVVLPTPPRSAESHIAFRRPRRDHFQRDIKRLQKCRCYCCPSLWRRKDARSAHAKRLRRPWLTDTRERGDPAHLSTKRRVPPRLSAPAPRSFPTRPQEALKMPLLLLPIASASQRRAQRSR